MTFNAPYAFLLLLLVPLLWWVRGFRVGGRRRASLRFSWTGNAAQAGRSWRQRFAFLPLLLRLAAIVLIVVALARPQKGMEQVEDPNEGIAIQMVVDRSSSMREGMMFEGRQMNRLEVVKRVFEEFVVGNGEELKGRPNDLIGLISFAGYAEEICPLILGHGALPEYIRSVQLARSRAEDGTAIGDAIALAAAKLVKMEERVNKLDPDRADKYEMKSKVMILLTDGEQTAGTRTPLEGAAFAREFDIKIYTIAVGGNPGRRNSPFGALNLSGRGVDTRTLQAVAAETGGQFFKAENASALAEIYKTIDELEKSEIQSLRFLDYKELFLPFALAALALLGVEVILSCTLFRTIP